MHKLQNEGIDRHNAVKVPTIIRGPLDKKARHSRMITFRYCDNVIGMLETFKNMCDGCHCLIRAVQHQMDPKNTDGQPIPSALYRPGPETKDSRKQEGSQILTMDSIEQMQTVLGSPIVFLLEKYGIFHCSSKYRKQSVMNSGPNSSTGYERMNWFTRRQNIILQIGHHVVLIGKSNLTKWTKKR